MATSSAPTQLVAIPTSGSSNLSAAKPETAARTDEDSLVSTDKHKIRGLFGVHAKTKCNRHVILALTTNLIRYKTVTALGLIE